MNKILFTLTLFVFFSCTKTAPTITLVNNKPIIDTTTKAIITSQFQGYKVQPFNKKDEVKYWRDCGVMWDVIADKFLIKIDGKVGSYFLPQITVGDFNNDGWIDIFNPGTGLFKNEVVDNVGWLIWNTTTKTFDNKNLFNNKTLKSFGGNQRRSVTLDLNKDGFSDVVIFDSGDDVPLPGTISELQPIRIVLSDGKGGYDLKDIQTSSTILYNHSGDIGDLNNDGYPDLVSATGSALFISWGIANYPYFSTNVTLFDLWNKSDNGFGEWFREASGQVYNVTIGDVDKDGNEDMILGCNEMKYPSAYNLSGFDFTTKIILNQGRGEFSKRGLINLPNYTNDNQNFLANDFRIVDINNDGLNDIISTGSVNYDNWTIYTYMQTAKNSFSIDTSKFIYTINTNRKSNSIGLSWKPWLIYYDFNGDGQKDISYIDAHDFWNNSLKRKTIFIRKGNNFEEDDFYKYDNYINKLK